MESQDQKLNTVLLSLYKRLADATKGRNMVCSPLSIYVCFALLAEGSSGQSLKEMRELFGYQDGQEILPEEAKKALGVLIHSEGNKDSAKGAIIKMCNSLYTNDKLKIEAKYQELLKQKYKAVAKSADFSAPATLKEINDSITEATNGLLKDTISDLDSMTVCVLINTIYFKGLWENPFKKSNTCKGDFHKSDGSTQQVDFMNASDMYASIISKSGCLYLALPYQGDRVWFVVEMCKETELRESILENVIMAANTATMKSIVSLPKFKAEFKLSLNNTLKEAGLKSIFNPSRDFASIIESDDISVSDVIHQAFIQVDEEGTEAAAATVIKMRLLGYVATPEAIINKPFHYHIVDKESNLVMFSGKVECPEFK